jgi:Domain of unknown function (DUF4386)
MKVLRNQGRVAGLLYLLGSIPGFFALLYIPSRIIVHGNPVATAHNIVTLEFLFRLGIAADLAGQSIFIFVALALYHLLKQINRRDALCMLILILSAIPIAFLNELNSLAALLLARGDNFLSALDEPQRYSLVTLFLRLRGFGFDLAGIFWGLWLFPLGMLVYRSGFLPRLLGLLLMIACFAYLANSFTSLVLPQYQTVVSRWLSPIQLAEILFMLWLLIRGAIPTPTAPTANAA